MSYLVGYGARFRAREHHRLYCVVQAQRGVHRSAAQGFHDWFICKGASPNAVVGAIVGGPERRDWFRDKRDGSGDVAYPNMMDDETSFYRLGPRVATNNSRSI
jgi:hypothetical protein